MALSYKPILSVSGYQVNNDHVEAQQPPPIFWELPLRKLGPLPNFFGRPMYLIDPNAIPIGRGFAFGLMVSSFCDLSVYVSEY